MRQINRSVFCVILMLPFARQAHHSLSLENIKVDCVQARPFTFNKANPKDILTSPDFSAAAISAIRETRRRITQGTESQVSGDCSRQGRLYRAA
jgi:hypothetical protein